MSYISISGRSLLISAGKVILFLLICPTYSHATSPVAICVLPVDFGTNSTSATTSVENIVAQLSALHGQPEYVIAEAGVSIHENNSLKLASQRAVRLSELIAKTKIPRREIVSVFKIHALDFPPYGFVQFCVPHQCACPSVRIGRHNRPQLDSSYLERFQEEEVY